jgi:ribosomal protein L29
MNIKELKLKELPELNQLLSDSRRQLDELNFKAHQGQLKGVREIRIVKKDIAQIMTAINSQKK